MNGKMTFGEKIKNIRKNKNITQGELGKRVGKTQQAICKLERMESQPRYEMVVKLARALNVSLEELTSDTSFSSAIQFFMPMIPPTVTAQEHAVRVVSGKPVFYDPPKLKAARQKLIANLACHIPDSPIETGCRLIVKWLFPITGNHRDGEYKCTKPDTDNLQKLLKDCMTLCGYWQDDALVVSEIVEKFWAEHPGIWICIEEIEEGRAS